MTARALGNKTVSFVFDLRILLPLLIIFFGVGAEFVRSATVQIWSFLLINILLAQSINLLTGMAGQISIGHAGFFGIGAYVSGLLVGSLGFPLPASVLVAMLFGAIVGWALSFAAGRVRDFYLAMMTLGFGMIAYEIFKEWTSVTGGIMGMSTPSVSVRTLTIFGWQVDAVDYFRILLVVVACVIWGLHNLFTSLVGRALLAIHVSETAAGSIGIPHAAGKREAYLLSGALAGLAGGFYAHLVGYLGPESFNLARSVEVLVMAIVGGLGTLGGPIFGAAVFTYLPEYLQVFGAYQFMVYGLILMFVFSVMPKGIAGLLLPRPRYIKSVAARQPQPPVSPVSADAERTALSVSDLAISFQGLRALDGVSLEVRAGDIVALVGPNGSGKSTLVNIVSGLYRPDRGAVVFDGDEITRLPDHQVAKRGITRTFQDPRTIPGLTVRENVLLGTHRLYRQNRIATILGLPGALREEAEMMGRTQSALDLAGLENLAESVVQDLPYGDQRMTELARVLASDPRLVMLDEPAAGLSEVELERLANLIRILKQRGIGVLLIDHHMEFLHDLVDEVVVLDAGKMIYRGDMEGMYRSPTVIEAYLGQPAQKEGASSHA